MEEEINKEDFTNEALAVIDFISQSPSAFHAVDNVSKMLMAEDFEELKMTEEWHLSPHGRYFVRYNSSAIVAFTLPENGDEIARCGFRIIASHSDSPTLRVKPGAITISNGLRLRTETY
ncbi:MAG: hypothetical protein U0K36_04350, partial [Bacteroidales bacterium]|nr:hypothetical protein [Bacteroidales bacterium]